MAEESNQVVLSTRLDTKLETLTEYWSEDARAAATPIPLQVDEGEIKALLEAEWRPEGAETRQDAVLPDGAAFAGWDPQPSCPPTGSNTERVPNRSIIPYCAVGKLYMTFDGQNFVGSAWTIAGAGVFTAGHCVYERTMGGWADKVLFVPQFHKGQRPLGEWAAVQMASLKGWTDSRDFKFDLACFKTDRPIAPKTGALGWMANYPPNQGPYTGIGFPAGAPFDGAEMWRSTGNYRSGSNPIQAWGDMTGGCSGGPWEVWKGGAPLTNGLNSFRYGNDPKSIYSPHFGEGFLALYNWVK